MNKFGYKFLTQCLCRRSNPLVTPNYAYVFSSSRYNKPNKPDNTNKSQSSNVNKQILKTSSNLNKTSTTGNSKFTTPQHAKSKSTTIMTDEQKKQLALQQKLQTIYTELESYPTDSYQTVVENYKRVKARLNDRKVYIPNKPQLLMQIDKNMELVKEHHKVWRSPSTQTQRALTDTKKEIIQFQLQQAKKKYYLSLLQDQRALIGMAAGVIFITGCLQYWYFFTEELDPALVPPKMFL